ncbi:MAG: hypothetical protein CMJ58_20520 [Planctomycetaceae bacterium]|nr:hypothetical protein [Planctomycetaceae bacterium]
MTNSLQRIAACLLILLYLGGGVFGVALNQLLPDGGIIADRSVPGDSPAASSSGGGFFHFHGPDFHVHYHRLPAAASGWTEVDDDPEPAPAPADRESRHESQSAQQAELHRPLALHVEHASPLLTLTRLLQSGFFTSDAPCLLSQLASTGGPPASIAAPQVWQLAPCGRGPPRQA